MSFSARRGFVPALVLAVLRSEAAEAYRPTRTPGLVYDPWFGADSGYQTAFAYEPKAVTW